MICEAKSTAILTFFVQIQLMNHVAPCDLAQNEQALNVLQRMWEFLYSLPVDVIVMARQSEEGGCHRYTLLSGQLNYLGHSG